MPEIGEEELRHKVNDLWSRRRGSRTIHNDDLTQTLILLFERELESKTFGEIKDYVISVFCTANMPFAVLRHACQKLLKRQDHYLLFQHIIHGTIAAMQKDPDLRYSLDIIFSSVPVDHFLTIPAPIRSSYRIHFGADEDDDAQIPPSIKSTAWTDETMQTTILFFISMEGGRQSCRRCVRQAIVFWRETYPKLRPLWMREQHVRSTGLHMLSTYQQWYKEDQRLYLTSLGDKYNSVDPLSMEDIADTPFFFLIRTTELKATFHHVFDVFMLNKLFRASAKKNGSAAVDPFDRSVLDQKKAAECAWTLRQLRSVCSRTLPVLRCDCLSKQHRPCK